jgi:hypothetical protein
MVSHKSNCGDNRLKLLKTDMAYFGCSQSLYIFKGNAILFLPVLVDTGPIVWQTESTRILAGVTGAKCVYLIISINE